MKNLKHTTLFAALLMSTSCSNQDNATKTREKVSFPETEIFVFDIDLTKKDDVLSNGQNVTNRVGYDNQPYFTKDSGSFVYARSDEYQTDVYEYVLETGEHKRLTNSPESEFSPTPSPDNTQMSFVFERNSSVWHANRGMEDAPTWSLETSEIVEPIGYFARNYKTGDLLYWSREGLNIALTNTNEKVYQFVIDDAVPSTPHLIPGKDTFSFVHSQSTDEVWIKEFDPKTKAIRPLTAIIGANANYGWTPDGSILMIEKDKLYRNDLELDQSWIEIADLTKHGISGANRVAISPNSKKLAVVGLPSEN